MRFFGCLRGAQRTFADCSKGGEPAIAFFSIAFISPSRRLAEGALLRRWDHLCAFFAFSLTALPSTSYPQFVAQFEVCFRKIGVFVAQPVVRQNG